MKKKEPKELEVKIVVEPEFVTKSKIRCIERGLVPYSLPAPGITLTRLKLAQRRIKYSEVLSVIRFFGEKILQLLEGAPLLILFTDDEANVLEMFGDATMKEIIERLGILEGIRLNEESMGTNAVALALQQQSPVQTVGEEHFHEFLHGSACYCVPFHFPEISNLSGSVAIMTSKEHHSIFQLAILANMVDSAFRELLLRRTNKTQHLLNSIMISTVKNGVILTDKFGNITQFNHFAEKITNRTREEVIGGTIFSFEQFGNLIYDVLKNGVSFEDVELTFTSSLDHRIVCLFDAIPIFDEQGDLVGAYAQFRDITDRYELEKQIITSEKFSAIGKMAAGLAHEIRNPLTSITGFIQLLKQRLAHQEHEYRYIELIYQELLQVNKLVSDFVLMAKPSSPDRKQCVIQQLILDTVQFMESQAILNNTIILPQLMPEPVELFIDPAQMKQVLVNLIQNAIDAMPKGGIVRIDMKLCEESQKLKISIRDEGTGMSEQEMKQILNPFFTTKENGLGLGLSVSYRIIENHKGDIAVSSQKGVGTTFDILLPLTVKS